MCSALEHGGMGNEANNNGHPEEGNSNVSSQIVEMNDFV